DAELSYGANASHASADENRGSLQFAESANGVVKMRPLEIGSTERECDVCRRRLEYQRSDGRVRFGGRGSVLDDDRCDEVRAHIDDGACHVEDTIRTEHDTDTLRGYPEGHEQSGDERQRAARNAR